MNKQIGSKIRFSRLNRRETQKATAARMGASQQLVSRIEKGKGSLDQIVRICRALGIQLELKMDHQSITLVHPIDPEERKEIEANIAWFSRIKPEKRLRVIEMHCRAIDRLRKAAARGR